jgi:hypothetical protein
MESLSMDAAELRMEQAIQMIEQFLESTTTITPAAMKELSRSVALAKAARDQRSPRSPRDFSFSELSATYRRNLERLRLRLREVEDSLRSERNRLLEEEARVSRTREWHTLLSRTR